MKTVRDMTVGELAAFVADRLANRGIRAVLSGGTCVTIYAEGAYVSEDLDFVPETYAKPADVAAALAEAGFVRDGRIFRHPECSTVVDVRSPPPAVGREPIKEVRELRFPTGVLRIISPTDCVKDRLANYYYFGDRACAEQACLVAAATEVDLSEVERWSLQEGQGALFEEVRRRLLDADGRRRRKSDTDG